ncbi:MAG TPA: NADH-quinone oxidoreductase subunit N [Bryobacteraceae bacterium]|nr:NADH-quinone oxidoreductase subunit N [Bryobacteraceae bacterium]
MPIANFLPTNVDYARFLPELILTVAGVLIMFLEALRSEGRRTNAGLVAILALVLALPAALMSSSGPAFQGMLVIDGMATFFRTLVIVVGLLVVFSSTDYLRRENQESGEYYALILFSIVGQCVMVSANELVMIFIGLEISSIASYILAGYLRDDARNNEAALKYFLLGSFATAFLLYGVAWMYGATGSTNLTEIRRALISGAAPPEALIGVAAALIFVGLAFKISAAPFQGWAPDVYQGAPAPVSAFLTVGPKAAAFAVLLRIFLGSLEPIAARWAPAIWVCALATMVVGNFAAIMQSNIKRLLAYSSIAHAGYVLVAVAANSGTGSAAAMFYLAAYAFTNIGAFAVVTYFSRKGERYVGIDDFAGLAQRQPGMAAMLTIFLLSLIGVPLTGGFFGKFYIFKAALDSKLIWLTVLGLLNSAVAAYYYLRILVVMYFREPGESVETLPPAGALLQIAVYGSAVGTLLLGIFPSLILDFANRAAIR